MEDPGRRHDRRESCSADFSSRASPLLTRAINNQSHQHTLFFGWTCDTTARARPRSTPDERTPSNLDSRKQAWHGRERSINAILVAALMAVIQGHGWGKPFVGPVFPECDQSIIAHPLRQQPATAQLRYRRPSLFLALSSRLAYFFREAGRREMRAGAKRSERCSKEMSPLPEAIAVPKSGHESVHESKAPSR